MPPGIFVFLLLIAGFYAKRFKAFFIACAAVFYIFSTQVMGSFLLSTLEDDFNKPSKIQDVDAVVILSGGSIAGSANLPLQNSAFKRVMHGVMLAKKQNLPIIYTGGGLKTYNASHAAKDTIKELNEYLNINLPIVSNMQKDFSIIFEDKSLDTYQNAIFTKEIFAQNSITKPKIYLVTSAFHMKRSLKLFKNAGFIIYPRATDFMSVNELSYLSYFPAVGGLATSFFALNEYFGRLSRILLK